MGDPQFSLALGAFAQAPVFSSVVINATGAPLVASASGCTFVKPLRRLTTVEPGFLPVVYDALTGELQYQAPP
jgi:hypothetical protein